MFLPERLKVIKSVLLDKKMVDVSTLSSILSVTEVTVRRDLEKLEQEGFLIKTHGGAILNEEDQPEPEITDESEHIEDIRNVAKLASYIIHDRSSIILSGGANSRCILPFLKNKSEIRIITNDILVASQFSNCATTNKVVLCGGDLDLKKSQLFGRIAEENFHKLFADIAFIEVDGVDFERGITVDSSEKASLINSMTKAARNVVYLCDYSKFGYISYYPIGSISLINTIISNENTPAEYKSYFYNNDIKLITTFEVCEEV